MWDRALYGSRSEVVVSKEEFEHVGAGVVEKVRVTEKETVAMKLGPPLARRKRATFFASGLQTSLPSV